MQLLSTLLLAGAASASVPLIAHSRTSHMALHPIVERQVSQYCKPIAPNPTTCEQSCGFGSVECVAFPHCWNPVAGESCCTTGQFCPRGTYCTDAGCCPDEKSLEECNAKKDLTWLSNTRPTPDDASIDPGIDTEDPTGEPTGRPTKTETNSPTDTATTTEGPSESTSSQSRPTEDCSRDCPSTSTSKPAPTLPVASDDEALPAPAPPPFQSASAPQIGGMALFGVIGALLLGL